MGHISHQSMTVLTDADLRRVAPSIFAAEPWEGMSDRYAFIPTIKLIDSMRQEGLQPFYAVQAKSRVAGKQDFTKHLIRFRDTRQGIRPANETDKLGGLFPEVVITNSHDGASTYQVDGGVFREICVNGLRTGESYSRLRVRHSGSADDILTATFKIVDEFPRVIEQAQGFAQLQLTGQEQQLYAETAIAIRYDDVTKSPVRPTDTLRVRRREDAAPHLFNVFNRVQETLVEGRGVGYNQHRENGSTKRVKVRAVNGISENTRINQLLWDLTAKFAALKGGDLTRA